MKPGQHCLQRSRENTAISTGRRLFGTDHFEARPEQHMVRPIDADEREASVSVADTGKEARVQRDASRIRES
jgi:hypothetical protein